MHWDASIRRNDGLEHAKLTACITVPYPPFAVTRQELEPRVLTATILLHHAAHDLTRYDIPCHPIFSYICL
jgi:hypothetical protein